MGAYQELYYSVNPYMDMDIDNAEWFKDLFKDACRGCKREGRYLKIYFATEAEARSCMDRATDRNISAYLTREFGNEEYIVEVAMIWKEGRPTRRYPRHRQILT